jgi:hypothetical protein
MRRGAEKPGGAMALKEEVLGFKIAAQTRRDDKIPDRIVT